MASSEGHQLQHVVVCIDADCFYAMVEHRRLSIPHEKPLAVQQWEGLIAVNYAARKFGVKRGDRVEEAMRKCPELICVHVETIGGGEGKGAQDRSTCKVSLERYRQASAEVMAIIQQYSTVVEKASVDEAYVAFRPADLPGLVEGMDTDEHEEGHQAQTRTQDAELEEGGFRAEELVGLEGHRLDPSKSTDLPLILAARVVARIRSTVNQRLGFTLSAGIAWNKMLAKLASAKYKPNRQTVVPLCGVQSLLSTVSLHEVRGLGGKLGEAVGGWAPHCKTAADLQQYSQDELVKRFGHKHGTWLYKACRGWDDEPVTANLKPKSMLAYKSFDPLPTVDGVRQWLCVLATELVGRMERDREAYHRRPRTLVLQFRGQHRPDHLKNWVAGRVAELTPMVSRSCPMPPSPTHDALVQAALGLFNKCGGQAALPCTRLALGASDFVDIPSDKASISRFLVKPAASTSPSDAQGPVAPAPCDKAAVGDKTKGGREEQGGGPRRGIMGFFRKGAAPQETAKGGPASVVQEPEPPPLHDDGSGASSSTTDTQPAAVGIRWCPRCPGVQVPLTQEHEDYHFALDLQSESSGRIGHDIDNRLSVGSKKRSGGQRRMETFFNKRPCS